MEDQRIISPQKCSFDESDSDRNLRPPSLSEFTGQDDIKESLSIAIEAAKHRGDALDHCLFAGPPGLGKTTLSSIIAKEMGVNIHITSGLVLKKASDLAGLLTSLQENDILFIDEIHRLNSVVEEYLYPAMEDFRLDIMLDSGPAARSVNLPLKHFTLVGATTRSGLLTGPLRDRFGLHTAWNFTTKRTSSKFSCVAPAFWESSSPEMQPTFSAVAATEAPFRQTTSFYRSRPCASRKVRTSGNVRP